MTWLLVLALALANELALVRYMQCVSRDQVARGVLMAVVSQVTTYLGVVLIVLDSLWLFIPLEVGTAIGAFVVIRRGASERAAAVAEAEAEQAAAVYETEQAAEVERLHLWFQIENLVRDIIRDERRTA